MQNNSYNNSWKILKFDEVSELGLPGNKDPFHHDDLPYTSYHHWAIIGHETWGYRYSPADDSAQSRSPLPETFRLSRGDTLSLTGDIVIFPNDTLTVVEGSLIEFEPVTDRHQFSVHGADDRRAEIFVYGTLIAEGTPTDSIRFQGRQIVYFDPPGWGGIHVMEGGSVSLRHTQLKNTPVPAWPTGLTAQGNPIARSVTLSWDDPLNPSITHWEYQMKQGLADWGEWLRVDPSDWSTTSYTAENLLRGVTYQFQSGGGQFERHGRIRGRGGDVAGRTAGPARVDGDPGVREGDPELDPRVRQRLGYRAARVALQRRRGQYVEPGLDR